MTIIKSQQYQINKIGKKYNLKLIIIYGSYATGREKPGSDLDVAILGHKKIDFDELMKIQDEIAKVFGDNRDRELDVKSLDTDDILFRYQIMRDSQLIYGKSEDYHNLKTLSFREYLDARPLFRLEELLAKKTLKNLQ